MPGRAKRLQPLPFHSALCIARGMQSFAFPPIHDSVFFSFLCSALSLVHRVSLSPSQALHSATRVPVLNIHTVHSRIRTRALEWIVAERKRCAGELLATAPPPGLSAPRGHVPLSDAIGGAGHNLSALAAAWLASEHVELCNIDGRFSVRRTNGAGKAEVTPQILINWLASLMSSVRMSPHELAAIVEHEFRSPSFSLPSLSIESNATSTASALSSSSSPPASGTSVDSASLAWAALRFLNEALADATRVIPTAASVSMITQHPLAGPSAALTYSAIRAAAENATAESAALSPAATSASTVSASVAAASDTASHRPAASAAIDSSLAHLPPHILAALAKSPNVRLPSGIVPATPSSSSTADYTHTIDGMIPIRLRLTASAECDAGSVISAAAIESNLSRVHPLSSATSSSPYQRGSIENRDENGVMRRAIFWIRVRVENLTAAASAASDISGQSSDTSVQLLSHSFRLVGPAGLTAAVWQENGAVPTPGWVQAAVGMGETELSEAARLALEQQVAATSASSSGAYALDQPIIDGRAFSSRALISSPQPLIGMISHAPDRSLSFSSTRHFESCFVQFDIIIYIFSSAAIFFLGNSRAAGFLSYTFRRVRTGDEFIVTLPPMLLSVYAPNPSSSSLA